MTLRCITVFRIFIAIASFSGAADVLTYDTYVIAKSGAIVPSTPSPLAELPHLIGRDRCQNRSDDRIPW
jgi:hypothetical protein